MKVKVCMGARCTMMGANSIYDALDNIKEMGKENPKSINIDDLEVELVKCLDYCKKQDADVAPVVIIDDDVIFRATAQEISERIINELKNED